VEAPIEPEPDVPPEDPRTATIALPGATHPPAPPEPAPQPAAPAPIENAKSQPTSLVDTILAQAVSRVTAVVKPDAAAAVASTFGFPLGLMVAVLGYLVAQGRVDQRDPKLRAAPQTNAETIVPFLEEDTL
jgi:hypothetical protein